MTWEKRTGRLEMPRQLRVPPSVVEEIRMRAEVNDRTMQLEILHLIKLGMKAEPVEERSAAD